MINPFIIILKFARKRMTFLRLLRKIVKRCNFKKGKMKLPDGTEEDLYYSEKPTLISKHIKDVHPISQKDLKSKMKMRMNYTS